MRLFEEKKRTFRGIGSITEPTYTFLDRTARPEFVKVRDILENWFGRYPDGTDKKDLRSRFTNLDEIHHDAAFFELLLHETLLRLGCKAEPHPTLPGGSSTHPEFLVRAPGGDFYLEALVVRDESAAKAAARHRWNEAYEAIDSIKNRDFALDLTQEGTPLTSVPLASWKRKVERFLSQHDRLTVQAIPYDDRPTLDLEHAGLKVSFKLIPKNYPERTPDDEHLIWATMGPGEWFKTSKAINKKMEKKAVKYGEMEMPFILAVNVKKGWTMRNEYMDALFGEEGMRYYRDRATGESRGSAVVRVGGGVWMREDGKPRNENVSAALFFENVTEMNARVVQSKLFHHPWAKKPYGGELLVFPQMVPTEGGKYKEVEGKGLEAIFGEPIGFQEIFPVELNVGKQISQILKEKD